MRSALIPIAVLTGFAVILANPALVIGSVVVAAGVWVFWRMLRATVARRVIR